ncbi:PfkB family carbohydrate kinase [Nocardiopsis algeriensis]|uniref:RfaE bifunctional protein nucleotidyltransferase chain/domain n=1 Tax=Nocardiopsis algeriensis TaxID=1478215 RepID=A0A841IZL9_9ACTN|nr:rfaE bifunctional protein nucleotidyltransferase chain/domain [Nocardiopsis algeriensis]
MTARGPVVVVGDALLDADLRGESFRDCPDAPAPVLEGTSAWYRPGGAALAAHRARSDGRDVVLVTALGRDPAAETLAGILGSGIRLVGMPLLERTPVKTRIQANGRTVARMDEGSGGRAEPAPAEVLERVLRQASAVLVSDYGYGLVGQRAVRDVLAECVGRVPVVWDPHPRGADPVLGTHLATPNAAEAGVGGNLPDEALDRARELAGRWGVRSVAVTLGGNGAAWADGSGGRGHVPGEPVPGPVDTCGAGDAFAAACTAALADGGSAGEAVRAGVAAASAFVAEGGAGAYALPDPGLGSVRPLPGQGPDAAEVADRARRRGERLVATGGCFDLLHAGHIDLLRRARRLGDRLVVLINGDASVRALKGEGRPVVGAYDRARVLSALDCVDAVEVFDETTPVRALERLRPDVWVKGGDYDVESLPETPVVRRAGGAVVTVPLVPGHSTTGLITRIQDRGRDGLRAR